MDDMVKAALAKWPNVPDCYGWLGLDARGQWYLRDDHIQAAGPFVGVRDGVAASPMSKGSLLRHDKLIDFIGRNYEADGQGRWFFQNGPQRVYVELEQTPWVWRVSADGGLVSHTGVPASLQACFTDEQGHVYALAERGVGLVHTLDVWQAAELIDSGRWPEPEAVHASSLPDRFGYTPSPALSQPARP